ncbi:S8 family serine peptidase [Glycomyces luteolus]|uniref:S8 family serine peptidase n=1 Tax=Glycomyces luteolus TaxID=2670330 RepID=A0A9X3PC91_9ACTN|nr:S8 family serine peptidase [Glycomyces luteolus]MDA1362452.1 S8 family serine peptidase [Glycomyces luteolus]
MATAGTVMLTTTPALAQPDGWNLPLAPENDRGECIPIAEGGEPLNKEQWAKNFIGLEQAQQYNRGTFETGAKEGDPVTIAVIDSGVASVREADVFTGRLLPGYDWFDAAANGQCDSSGHGTAVAAIAAGNPIGNPGDPDFVGVAPEADILPIRVFTGGKDEGGDANKSKAVGLAIIDAVDHGADVINISSVMLESPDLAAGVEYAMEKDVVIVAASGNATSHMDDDKIDADKQTFYPANYPEVIAVGAHNPEGNWYEGTNFGNNLDLLAPGVEVPFPHASGEWFVDQGTSYAAPFVAGAAALLKGQYGAEATPAWIQQRLQETAIHPPNEFNIYQGHGILNVGAALTAPIEDPAAIVSDTASEAPSEEPSSTPIADEDRQSIVGLDPDYDPLRTEKTMAWASVGIAIVLVTLVLVLKKIIPKGRNRRWRPGTRKPDVVPVKAATD